MTDESKEQVRSILLLPNNSNEQIYESASEQIAAIVDFLHNKLADYNEVIQQNSIAVFVVNYVQNRFITTEFCSEIAKLFNVLNVKSYDQLMGSLEELKSDSYLKPTIDALFEAIGLWDNFVKELDTSLDKTIGEIVTTQQTDDKAVLGIQSNTISYYVRGSPFEFILIVVVRAFNKPKVNDHILELYKKINDLRKLKCDVFLLTKGPPIGASGGAYVKLIGVPFRKLYDAEEAENELKIHRKSAEKYTNWKALCKVVEASFVEENNADTSGENNTSRDEFITQKGGTVLVDKSGNFLFKHVEDETKDEWPDIQDIVKILEDMPSNRASAGEPKKNGAISKVDSEISAANEKDAGSSKSCCIIC